MMQPIIVGVVLALLVGGSAPWWWDEIGPGDRSGETITTQATTVPSTTGQTTSATGATTGATSGGSTGPIDVSDCQITIRNPLVSLREEPDHFGLEVGRVEPGSYAVDEAAIVNRGVGPERWFRITADGRSGWVEDNAILIESKSSGCP